jgi:hypothetical protein
MQLVLQLAVSAFNAAAAAAAAVAAADAEWPEPLLLHKSTCLDTAATLELKRRQRQDRWQTCMTRAVTGSSVHGGAAAAAGWQAGRAAIAAAGAADGAAAGLAAAGAAGVAGNEPDGPLEHFPDTLPPAPLVAVDQDPAAAYEDEEARLGQGQGSSSDNEMEARMAVEGTAQGGAGGKVSWCTVCRSCWSHLQISNTVGVADNRP